MSNNAIYNDLVAMWATDAPATAAAKEESKQPSGTKPGGEDKEPRRSEASSEG